MQSDLLEAKAAVDWAFSQLPSLGQRIEEWSRINIDFTTEETNIPSAYYALVIVKKENFPLFFNAEIGAYLNTIRSSLDILATALAYRYGVAKPERAAFPIVYSEAKFLSGGYSAFKFINGLPDTPRSIIESLKPYKGGNDALWSLHDLDNKRKHRNLLDVAIRPITMHMHGRGPADGDFTPLPAGNIRLNEKTIIGLMLKSAPYGDMRVSTFVSFDEVGIAHRKPVTAALAYFGSLAQSIINLFDET